MVTQDEIRQSCSGLRTIIAKYQMQLYKIQDICQHPRATITPVVTEDSTTYDYIECPDCYLSRKGEYLMSKSNRARKGERRRWRNHVDVCEKCKKFSATFDLDKPTKPECPTGRALFNAL